MLALGLEGRTWSLPVVQRKNHLAAAAHMVQRRMWACLPAQPHLAICPRSRQASRQILLRAPSVFGAATRLRSKSSRCARRGRLRARVSSPSVTRREWPGWPRSVVPCASPRSDHGPSQGACGSATRGTRGCRCYGTVVVDEPESSVVTAESALIAESSRKRGSKHSGSRNGA